MKKILSLALVSIMLLCLIPSAAVLAASVTIVDAVNIELPIAGEKPDFSAELPNWSNAHKITGVEWVEYDEGWEWEKDMSANDTFKEGYWYVVYVHFETTSGNIFSETINPYINQETAQISGPAVQANRTKVSIYKAYQATKAPTAISRIDLTVVKPVVGKTPTFAKVDTTQYFSEKYGTVSNCSNGVTWTNQSNNINITVNNPFKEGSKYTVTYYLSAKDGYTFTTSTQCTINGAAATIELTDHYHAKVSLKNIIPDDGKKEMASINLSVTAPKDGEKPSYTKIDSTGYVSDNGSNGTSTKIYKNGIAWFKSTTSYISPGTTETFTGNTNYTLKIFLSPKDGYKFGGALTAKINGRTATVEHFDDGSVSVSVTLTALSKDHAHTDSGWLTSANAHWKTCTDASCGMITVAKASHADANQDRICDICGYKAAAEAEPMPETSTEIEDEVLDDEDSEAIGTLPEDHDGQPKDEGSNYWIWIILGSAILLGGGAAVVVILLVKRRKSTAKEEPNE